MIDILFDNFVSTLPNNQKPTEDFDVYRYWELNGKPKDFEEAKKLRMYTLEDDGLYHAKSVAKNGEEYEWTKSLNHPNRGMELMWYEFNPEFKKLYQIQLRDGKLFYIPRKKNGGTMNYLDFFKKGGKPKIHIKKKNRGKFTDYCGGTVTEECIQRGKHSSNPATRKRAAFAANARKWKHQTGGQLINPTKGTFFSRAKVETPEQKKYTIYLPEDNTSDTYQREATSNSTSYDLSGYTLPTVTITTSSESKSDNKLHADINGLLDLFNKYDIRVRVTSGYREGATTKSGNKSHHSTGRAIDIVPEDGDFSKLAQVIKNTPEIKDYMISKGLGVLDETTQEMLAHTGGTGAHYHIGPDHIAQKFWTT